MREDVLRVSADMDVEDAASMLAQYDLLAVPSWTMKESCSG